MAAIEGIVGAKKHANIIPANAWLGCKRAAAFGPLRICTLRIAPSNAKVYTLRTRCRLFE
jgi:hypothetical protein